MTVSIIIKVLCAMLSIPIAIIVQKKMEKVYEILHDKHVDKGLDILSILFSGKIFYIKLLLGEHWDLHSIFEQIFFYGGGIVTLFWGAFRIKLQYLEYKEKKLSIRLKQKEINKK
jgi:hypothetical protein